MASKLLLEEIRQGKAVAIDDVLPMLPGKQGKKLSYQAVLQWILEGSKDPHGKLVRLDAVRIGCKWCTSREAVERYIIALTPVLESVA